MTGRYIKLHSGRFGAGIVDRDGRGMYRTRRNLGCTLSMKTEANPYNGALPARDASELRDTLFRTLSDLRAGRITAQEAKAVTDAVTKALFGHPQRIVL